jgi:hypothetical protein
MVIAQALGEYGAASAIASAFSNAWLSLSDYLSRIEPSWPLPFSASLISGLALE